MKAYFVLIGSTVLIAGTSCKKYNSDYNPPVEKKWVVSTVAGEGSADFVDGPLLAAKFHFPEDLVVTNDGVIYVTDGGNSRIRKIIGQRVETFAGSSFGIVNSNGVSAKFEFPFSIGLDPSDNLYTSDVRDARIRKLNSAADVFSYAGSDEEGFADGNIATAKFGEEKRVVVDDEGNVYVADSQNNRVRKISVSGIVSTIAGNGTAGSRDGNGQEAQFNFPDGIAIDRQGNLYVSDGGNYCIRKITPQGEVSVFAGTSGSFGTPDGDKSSARFNYPTDLSIDNDGNLYVIDISRIRKITPQGNVSTIAGSENGYADGNGANARFFTPDGITVDSHGNIYVADTDNNRIRKISLE